MLWFFVCFSCNPYYMLNLLSMVLSLVVLVDLFFFGMGMGMGGLLRTPRDVSGPSQPLVLFSLVLSLVLFYKFFHKGGSYFATCPMSAVVFGCWWLLSLQRLCVLPTLSHLKVYFFHMVKLFPLFPLFHKLALFQALVLPSVCACVCRNVCTVCRVYCTTGNGIFYYLKSICTSMYSTPCDYQPVTSC